MPQNRTTEWHDTVEYLRSLVSRLTIHFRDHVTKLSEIPPKNYCFLAATFLLRDASAERGYEIAYVVRPSVCLSVCPSVRL